MNRAQEFDKNFPRIAAARCGGPGNVGVAREQARAGNRGIQAGTKGARSPDANRQDPAADLLDDRRLPAVETSRVGAAAVGDWLMPALWSAAVLMLMLGVGSIASHHPTTKESRIIKLIYIGDRK